MGMDGRTVDTQRTLLCRRWTVGGDAPLLRGCGHRPIFPYQHGGARMRSIIHVCVRVCGPTSVSSLASAGSPVSSLQSQGSSVHCQASSVVMSSRDPGQNLEGQPRFPRVLLASK